MPNADSFILTLEMVFARQNTFSVVASLAQCRATMPSLPSVPTVKLRFPCVQIVSFLYLALTLVVVGPTSATELTFKVQDLDLSGMYQQYSRPEINRSISKGPLMIAGQQFTEGIGSHANSSVTFDLDGKGKRFSAFVGVDEAEYWRDITLAFRVFGDGRLLFESGVMTPKTKAKRIDLDIEGIRFLTLEANDNEDGILGDHANWCEPLLVMKSGKPLPHVRPVEPDYILTPPTPLTPQLNMVERYGVVINRRFSYRIPCTGMQPLEFRFAGLPPQITFDKSRRVLTGVFTERGTHKVTITARNEQGQDAADIVFVVGDTMALTPVQGWNSWYPIVWGVTSNYVLWQAQQLIRLGLADNGYDQVHIDDAWQDFKRGPDSQIRANYRIGEMSKLISDVHALGIKFGIYTSPGPETCVGEFVGSYANEELDAQTFCSWGVDFVKSDLCSFEWMAYKDSRNVDTITQIIARQFGVLGQALERCDREMQYLACTYGKYTPWKWDSVARSNYWRTGGDIPEGWFGVIQNGFSQAPFSHLSKPGSWKDLDHLRLGLYRHRDLTPHERYTKVSLWALLKSPMILGFNLDDNQDTVLSLLRNREVGQLTRDARGVAAKRVVKIGRQEAWAMPMSDSSWAVGLFNRDDALDMVVGIPFDRLGIAPEAKCRVRDLWRQQDVGTFSGTYAKSIPSHGVQLLRIWPNRVSSVDSPVQGRHSMLSIFPNPASGLSTVALSDKKESISRVEVFQINGRKVIDITAHTESIGSLTFDTSSLETGAYYLAAHTSGGRYFSTLTVTR